MQPYLFPYIGYFQLVASVDRFVVYDDVTFIKQGWINRNNVLLNGSPFMFTVPLLNASSNTLICDTGVSYKQAWAPKLLKTLEQAYRKAPHYAAVLPIIESVLLPEAASVSELATRSIKAVCGYLGIQTEIISGSSHYGNRQLSAQDRVLDICRLEGATQYHNPIGGRELYSKADFSAEGIELFFIRTPLMPYRQLREPFVPWLSVIDIMMFNEPAEALRLIQNYELI